MMCYNYFIYTDMHRFLKYIGHCKTSTPSGLELNNVTAYEILCHFFPFFLSNWKKVVSNTSCLSKFRLILISILMPAKS